MLYSKRKWMGWLFVLPFVLFAVVLLLYPFFGNFVNMFYKFKDISDVNPIFVGWENARELFTDKFFWWSIGNTFILIACVIVFQMGIALILALLVNSLGRSSKFFRVVFFIPIVLSGTTLGTMFLMFSHQDTGLFNQLLALIGIEHGTWLPNENRFASLVYVLIPIIWQYVGFYFVILLTGLSSICEDFLEAARIDGASGLTITFKIVLPMLWNVFRTCMVLSITGAMKVFDVPHVMARSGAPGGKTFFMGTYNSYLFSFGGGVNAGKCAMYSILLVLIGVLISQISNAVFRENKDI